MCVRVSLAMVDADMDKQALTLTALAASASSTASAPRASAADSEPLHVEQQLQLALLRHRTVSVTRLLRLLVWTACAVGPSSNSLAATGAHGTNTSAASLAASWSHRTRTIPALARYTRWAQSDSSAADAPAAADSSSTASVDDTAAILGQHSWLIATPTGTSTSLAFRFGATAGR